jgi:hypothetical protein
VPLYRYRVTRPPCRLCGEGFECLQAAQEPALTECPKCGLGVARATDTDAFVPRLLKPLSGSAAKNAGFSIFRRTSDGNLERTNS